jgi:hypothetical protein
MADRVSGTGGRAAQGIHLTIRIDGAQATLKALRDLPKEASNELRDAAQGLSEKMARWVIAAGQAEGRQASLLTGTVKAKRDRLPYMVVGGTKRIGHAWPGAGRAPAYQLLFGSEFGASTGHGFKPHRGKVGYWVFPTIEHHEGEIAREWERAADHVVDRFSHGGPDIGTEA